MEKVEKLRNSKLCDLTLIIHYSYNFKLQYAGIIRLSFYRI